MRKVFLVVFLVLLMGGSALSANTLTFNEIVNKQNKPAAVLVYSDWADDKEAVFNVFDEYQMKYAKKYNFLKLNIASEDAKIFNKTFYIYPNLPYIILFKDKGKTSRYIIKECILKDGCMRDKFDYFIN